MALVALLVMAVCDAIADDTYVERIGGTAKMIKGHPTIRMVREHVRIEPVSGKVVATFVFRNEGPKQTVLIGFPESDFKGTRPYKRFWSTVDNEPVQVKPIKGIVGYSKNARYWTKQVVFDKGQTREVMVGYIGGKGEVSGGMDFMRYILESGTAWKGTIGQVRIDCDLNKLKFADQIKYSIAPDMITRTRASWNIRDWEPDNDWEVSWYPGFVSFKSNDQMRSYVLTASVSKHPSHLAGDEVLTPAKLVAKLTHSGILTTKRGFKLKNRKHEVEFIIGSKQISADGKNDKLRFEVLTEHGDAMIPLAKTLKLFGIAAWYDKVRKEFFINFPPSHA